MFANTVSIEGTWGHDFDSSVFFDDFYWRSFLVVFYDLIKNITPIISKTIEM